MFILENPCRVTGRVIVKEMRRHHCTIAMLAKRLGVPQWKVRRVREFGVDGYAGIDWLQGIRGTAELDAQLLAMFRHLRAADENKSLE